MTPAVAIGGVLLHGLVLAAPLLLLSRGGELLTDPRGQLFGLIATLFVVAELPASTARDDPAPRARGERGAHRLAAATGLVILACFWADLVEHAPGPIGPWQLAGAALMAAGVALRHAAIRALGGGFVTRPQPQAGRTLVCGGVYRVLRHPSETGTLAIVTGASLLLGSRVGLLGCALVLLPLIVVRVRREDRCLREAFDERYDAYAARVGGLVPRLPRLERRSGS